VSLVKRRTHVIIHHSADKDDYGLDFDNYLDFHTRVRIWRDIGYNYVNEEVEGHVINIVGRSLLIPGAHCPGMNAKSIGFCFAGNFSREAGPSDKRIHDAVRRVIVPCMVYHNIPIEHVMPHRAYAKTECPGNFFRWSALIKEIKETLDGV
jgi:N-acetylmuramoyl-L-alanine amidase